MISELIQSAAQGDFDRVRMYLDNGADLESVDDTGKTALIVASEYGHFAVAGLLIDGDAKIDAQDHNGWTALLAAVSSGRTRMVKLCMQSGANVNLASNDGTAALMLASELGHTRIAKLLLSYKAHINAQDLEGSTALMVAATSGRKDTVKLLLDYGAQIDVRDSQGCTALMKAASEGQVGIVKVLLDRRADPNAQDYDGNSALNLASNAGHDRVVELLLSRNAQTENPDSEGDTALVLAARSGHYRVVRTLLGMTPIGKRVAGIAADIIDELSGTGIKLKNISQDMFQQQTKTSSEKDAKETGTPNESQTPKQTQSANVLIAHEEIELSNSLNPPLIACATKSELKHGSSFPEPVYEAHDLLERHDGPPLSSEPYSSHLIKEIYASSLDEALMESAKHGHEKIVRHLLKAGATVDCRNSRGLTPLMCACIAGHLDMAKLLLRHGADLTLKDSNGDTALLIAVRNGHREVAEALLPIDAGSRNICSEIQAVVPGNHIANGFFSAPPRLESLARFLAQEFGDDQLMEINREYAPAGAKGTPFQVLQEVLHEIDLARFLEGSLGAVGVRKAVEKLAIEGQFENHKQRIEALLNHFEARVIHDQSELGPHQTCLNLHLIEADIRQTQHKEHALGFFNEACALLERLVRIAVWGWAQLVFGAERDASLTDLLKRDKKWDKPLTHLTFGDVARLFCDLPDFVHSSKRASEVMEKLGRTRIYLPKNRKCRLADRLFDFVALRNRVAHRKEGFGSNSSLREVRTQLADATAGMKILVQDMIGSGAVPSLARITEETKDQLHRLTYKLVLDDGTSVSIHSNHRLQIGKDVMYFGSQSNPRPVDPLMLGLEDVGVVP